MISTILLNSKSDGKKFVEGEVVSDMSDNKKDEEE